MIKFSSTTMRGERGRDPALIRAALTLARRGLAVFPCRPRDKRPATANGVKDATTDLTALRRWWNHEPQSNVAIAAGRISGVFVLDLDGLDAEAELSRLEREYGQLPRTVETITARGRHLFFKMPTRPVRNSTGKIAPGIDVRGDGGYVLAPPSVHPSGRRYAWSVDSASTFSEAPEWVLAKITTTNSSEKSATQPSEWRTLVVEGVEEGQRDNAAARLCGHLLRRDVDTFVALEILQMWNTAHCRPPLPRRDIERIVASIAGKEIERRYGRGGPR